MITKYCSMCKDTKPISDFGSDVSRKDKLSNRCKECMRSYAKRYYKDNVSLMRDKDLQRRYGITAKEYGAKLAEQNNRCAICKQLPSTNRPLVVDHNHITNAARGLLCDRCNHGIGHFKENLEHLQSAIEYLKMHLYIT